jgi:hypothetical protein
VERPGVRVEILAKDNPASLCMKNWHTPSCRKYIWVFLARAESRYLIGRCGVLACEWIPNVTAAPQAGATAHYRCCSRISSLRVDAYPHYHVAIWQEESGLCT